MNRKLMIKILQLLESVYPDNYKVAELANKLGLRFLDKEFSKVMAYLASSTKIIWKSDSENEGMISLSPIGPKEECYITDSGIDFLTKLRSLEVEEYRSRATTKATIVLALVGFIEVIIYFKQFSTTVSNIYDWLGLCVIGALVMIIFGLAWSSLMDLNKKS